MKENKFVGRLILPELFPLIAPLCVGWNLMGLHRDRLVMGRTDYN